MNDTPAHSPAIDAPHALQGAAVLGLLGVDVNAGLSEAEVVRRRAYYGRNALAEHETTSALTILLHQIWSPVVGLLAAAAALSAAFGDWPEALAVVFVLAINSAIGFTTEMKAQRSMTALRQLGSQHQRVRRNHQLLSIPAHDLVPGDVVLLEEGDVATADIRLLSSLDLGADESALTGESVPVSKAVAPMPADTILAQRSCMIFKGTAITRGAAAGVVTATGTHTEVGRIARLAATAEAGDSPLTQKLAGLSSDLVKAVLLIGAVLAAGGIAEGHDPVLMLKAAISLAVAAIPEGLPVVATLVLARGMLRMADRNAVIEKLSAVETLGATTVILTDKTGTLTENRMTVVRLVTPEAELAWGPDAGGRLTSTTSRLLTAAALCNGATLTGTDGKPDGDPMEIALLAAARAGGVEREPLLRSMPEVERVAFDSTTKIMATVHRVAEGGVLLAVKGAPEAVIARATRIAGPNGDSPLNDALRKTWLDHVQRLGSDGLRVIALAETRAPHFSGHIGRDLTLLGLTALLDPHRAGVPEAIAACKSAGIKVVMVTGDHPGTAAAIAHAIGIGSGRRVTAIDGATLERRMASGDAMPLEMDVFARVTPHQKLQLVEAYQDAGHVVAMTGDGVNDAPALKRAAIGIAMGQRGTEVARQAAVMVLRDDAFPTIVEAVRQGRIIFGNIRRFVVYLLACNLSEVMIVSLAILFGMPLPLQPIQILFLNIVTDVFPALALAAGEGAGNVLARPPRDPAEPLVARRHWQRIAVFGLMITAATLGAMQLALTLEGFDRSMAATVSFLTLALAQLWFVFNMTEEGEPYFSSAIVKNRYVWAALALCAGVLVAAVEIDAVARVLKIMRPDALGLAIAVGMSLAATVAGAIALLFLRAHTAAKPPADPPA